MEPPPPLQPLRYTRGEMVEDWTGCGLGSEAREGVCSLSASQLSTAPLPAAHPAGDLRLVWQEERAQGRPGQKRAREAALALVVENGSLEHSASLVASLPSAARAQHVQGGAPLPEGSLARTLPRDATPGLPAALGALLRFSTVCAEVPPRTRAAICRCAHPSADALPGMVYLLSAGPPHPRPSAWCGLALRFPLAGQGPFLCTQGFGGRGHHRGPTSHHAADFAAPEGTPVLAMAQGTVVRCKGDAVLGGAHVDLLPESNFCTIRSLHPRSGAPFFTTYLHFSPSSLRVAVGQVVAAGQALGAVGSTGFSLGPHLHVQCNAAPAAAAVGQEDGEGEGPSLQWAFEPALPEQPPVVPTAGYFYTPQGTLAPNAAALRALRQRIGLDGEGSAGSAGSAGGAAPCGGASSAGAAGSAEPPPPLLALAQAALLWLHPLAFHPLPEDALPLHAQSRATAERCYPSLHTCLLANVLAPVSLLVDGSAARFAGAFPPLYLSCQLNFERDESSGELFSCELAPHAHQEGAGEELATVPAVRGVLDPQHLTDWQGFFRDKFVLQEAWEVWRGSAFVENVASRPARLGKGCSTCPVYTLTRCTLDALPSAAGGAVVGGRGGGAVCVFRNGPAEAEPFGVWLCWLVEGGRMVTVDLQNGAVCSSVREAVALLQWEEQPRAECFFAPFKACAVGAEK